MRSKDLVAWFLFEAGLRCLKWVKGCSEGLRAVGAERDVHTPTRVSPACSVFRCVGLQSRRICTKGSRRAADIASLNKTLNN